MTTPTAALICALDLLGRSMNTMPPIEFLAAPPPHVSPRTEAFVSRSTRTITLITSAAAFRDARCENRESLAKLASILVHEEWHVRNGADERGAYEAQLMSLMRLGYGPDSSVYYWVKRSMQSVLQQQKRPKVAMAETRGSPAQAR